MSKVCLSLLSHSLILHTLLIVIISPITLFMPAPVCQRASTYQDKYYASFEEVHHVTITHRENLLAEVRTQLDRMTVQNSIWKS